MCDSDPPESTNMSRRAFLEGTGAAVVIAAAAPTLLAQSPEGTPAPVPVSTIRVTVNGTVHRAPRGRGPLDAGRAAARSASG